MVRSRLMVILSLAAAGAAMPSGPSSAAEIEEIVVTAQKREQSLQDVPISMTVFSGQSVRDLGFQTPHDLFTQAPNVMFNDEGTIPQFNIRGVQVYDFGDANEPPVGFYVDEVYKATIAGQTAGLFDIERIEVLRGPQGTLFGRNTTGGLVHFVTRKPTEAFEAYGEFQYGSYNQRILEGAVSGPISDRIRARLALKYHEDDGWQENEFTGTDFAVTDFFAGRGQLEVDITNDMALLVSFYGSTQDNIHQGYGLRGLLDPVTLAPCPISEALDGQCVTATGTPSNLEPTEPLSDNPELQNDIDIWGISAKLTWAVGKNMELVSISAYETVDKFFQEDADASPAPVSPPLFPAFLANYSVDAEQFTQELRLHGSNDRWNWVVGGFYFNDDKEDISFINPQLTSFISLVTGIPQSLASVGIDNESTLDSESWALFGQADYDLTETLTLTGGLRYTEESKDLVITNSFATPIFIDRESLDTEKVTWKAGLSWRPIDKTLLYFTVSHGFKSGAFKTTFAGPGAARPVGEEELTSYEGGIKTELLGRRLRLNANLFYGDYVDTQAVTITAIAGAPAITLNNVGDVEQLGLEADATFAVTDNLLTIVGIGIIDTEIDSDDIQFDGNELAFTPTVQVNGVVRYELPIQMFGGNASLQSSFSYFDDHFKVPENFPEQKEEAYVLWGARARWASPSERYHMEVFVDNILDEEYSTGGFNVGDFAAVIWGRPRWAGFKVGVTY